MRATFRPLSGAEGRPGVAEGGRRKMGPFLQVRLRFSSPSAVLGPGRPATWLWNGFAGRPCFLLRVGLSDL